SDTQRYRGLAPARRDRGPGHQLRPRRPRLDERHDLRRTEDRRLDRVERQERVSGRRHDADADRHGRSRVNELRDLYRHRQLIAALTARDLKARYRGSVLGFFWSLANPLLLLAVYTLVFTKFF